MWETLISNLIHFFLFFLFFFFKKILFWWAKPNPSNWHRNPLWGGQERCEALGITSAENIRWRVCRADPSKEAKSWDEGDTPPSHPRLSQGGEQGRVGMHGQKVVLKPEWCQRLRDEDFQVTKTTRGRLFQHWDSQSLCFRAAGWGAMPQRVLFFLAERKAKAPRHVNLWDYFQAAKF